MANETSSEKPVSAAYAALVASGALTREPAQQAGLAELDRIAAALSQHDNGGLFARLRSRKPIEGAYLVGAVGRGKTMLMDLFYEAVPIAEKRRVHFHEFMDEMHAAIAAFRADEKHRGGDADPIRAVTKPLIRDVKLLCLDEFHVQDITNAMLLGRLFERLFAAGMVLVATSNTRPDDLYRDGLNRQLFVPFIDILKTHCRVVELDGPTDFRRLKFAGRDVFVFGSGPEVEAAMDRLWAEMTSGAPSPAGEVRSLGRVIAVPAAAMGSARFSFADLCEAPLGARDYLRIAEKFDALMVDDVPRFDQLRSDAAKRFILLVDTLYDRGVKLMASFAAPIDALAGDERTAADFRRTASRLVEMQSSEYLAAAHRQAAQ